MFREAARSAVGFDLMAMGWGGSFKEKKTMTASPLEEGQGMEEMSHIPLQPAQASGGPGVAARGPAGGRALCTPHSIEEQSLGGVGIPAAFVSMGAEGLIPPPLCSSEPSLLQRAS